ncbi:TRAP transporter small permease [Undibacterium crateris]|uniref:TRAP transporter small permease n=1 Tax=Undibacterium crateris TaxID=2528175 RepID=UPI0013899CDC|nr:TRAP transporter small permease [Undibacterium crateris]NDI87627.1 TRAP transporter small permease subunit [Undibacterium crateris]
MKYLNRLEESLITSLMISATCIIFIAVLHRFASTIPVPFIQDPLLALNLSWAQELCVFMFVWMAKFGAAYGVRAGIHVGVDVLLNRLHPKNRQKLILFGLCGGMLFTATVGTLGAMFVWGIAHTDQISEEIHIPMWLIYLCIPLGSYLMCFRFFEVAIVFFRTGELPHHDIAHVEGLENYEGAK